MRVQLIPLDGGDQLDLPEGATLVGRDEACDLRLPLPLVSKIHCVLIKFGRCLMVWDLGSTNGTLVNGSRVARRALCAEDLLDVGSAVFRVATGGERPPEDQ